MKYKNINKPPKQHTIFSPLPDLRFLLRLRWLLNFSPKGIKVFMKMTSSFTRLWICTLFLVYNTICISKRQYNIIQRINRPIHTQTTQISFRITVTQLNLYIAIAIKQQSVTLLQIQQSTHFKLPILRNIGIKKLF